MQGGADKSVSLTTHDGGGQSSPTATGDTRQGFAEFLDLKGLGEKEVNPAVPVISKHVGRVKFSRLAV